MGEKTVSADFDRPPARGSPEAPLAFYQRLHELDALLPALTNVLDVRAVFERVSTIAKKVFPHDSMIVSLAREDGEGFDLHAMSGQGTVEEEDTAPLTKSMVRLQSIRRGRLPRVFFLSFDERRHRRSPSSSGSV